MASTVALSLTKWSLDVASRLIRSDARLHIYEAITDDMAIIFVVNHFTRLETMLLPYIVHKHTGKEVGAWQWELFKGRIGRHSAIDRHDFHIRSRTGTGLCGRF